MKSLKELTASNLAQSERKLNPIEASMVIAVIKSMRSETSDYEVEGNKLKHWHKETKGLITREYINGRLFKETETYPNGNKKKETWYKNGKKHRNGRPADLGWHENGNRWYEAWYKNDKFHRRDGIAQTVWFPNGNKNYEVWYKNGKEHREDGPAEIWYNEFGVKTGDVWYKNGKQILYRSYA